MFTARVLIFLMGMSVSATAVAGFSSFKEPVDCVGAYQGYLFSWLQDPHDCDIFKQQFLRYPQGWITQNTSYESSGCIYVGTGMPFGGGTTNWKTRGEYCPVPNPRDSNWVAFYHPDDCGEIP